MSPIERAVKVWQRFGRREWDSRGRPLGTLHVPYQLREELPPVTRWVTGDGLSVVASKIDFMEFSVRLAVTKRYAVVHWQDLPISSVGVERDSNADRN